MIFKNLQKILAAIKKQNKNIQLVGYVVNLLLLAFYFVLYLQAYFNNNQAKMSDAWEEIQAIKNKRMSLREKLQKRKKERQELLGSSVVPPATAGMHYIIIHTVCLYNIDV